MPRVVVTNSLTLDGVMQAPGRPDEDRRGGFAHGGWAVPRADSVMAGAMAEGIAKSGPPLLGRRTYEDFAAGWPKHAALRLVDTGTTTTGVVIATYQPAEALAEGRNGS